MKNQNSDTPRRSLMRHKSKHELIPALERRILMGALSGLFSSAILLAACSASDVENGTRKAILSNFVSPIVDDVDQRDPLPLLVPYRGLMVGIVDWSAYGIFTVAESEKQLNDSDWTAAGMAAVNIIATSTLLTMPGSGKVDAVRLADPKWRDMVAEMQNASVFVAMAVQQKNRSGLTTAADLLAESCRVCHEHFTAMPQGGRDFADLH